MRLLIVAVTVFLMAGLALAADVDGKWTGTIATPNGDFPQAFTFKADGASLSGAMIGPDGKDIPIKEGKLDGSTISFTVTIDFGGMAIVLTYKGVVAKEEIKFTGEAMGMPFDLTVKKSS